VNGETSLSKVTIAFISLSINWHKCVMQKVEDTYFANCMCLY